MSLDLAAGGSGKLLDNLALFGRMLRHAGVQLDAEHIAVSAQAALLVGLSNRQDVSAALEAVLVRREQDRRVFRELFDACFAGADSLQQLPVAKLGANSKPVRARVGDAIADALGRSDPQAASRQDDESIELDGELEASAKQRLRHAEFSSLSASEYRQVESLACRIPLLLPEFSSRRRLAGGRGAELHWPGVLHKAVRSEGEAIELPRLRRRDELLPLLLLVDISGSMKAYSRLLLAFLHASTRRHPRRDVFAFGTQLTDLTPCFRHADTDDMLIRFGSTVPDFAGGTRLGEALATLRKQHARRFLGGRTVVLLVSDGLDTGDPEKLGQELASLKRRCRNLLWLNPLLRFDAYTPLARGAAQLQRYSDATLAVHDLSRLEELASSLASLLRRRRR